MSSILPNGKTQFFDINGRPLVNGKVFYYEPNTETPKATYADADSTIPNTNPVVLDGRGEAAIWGTGMYRQVLVDANGVQIWDTIVKDPASSFDQFAQDLANANDPALGDALVGVKQPITGAVARTQHDKNMDVVSVRDFGVKGDGTDEYDAMLVAWTSALNGGFDLYFPPGTYDSGARNMPFRSTVVPATELLDCKNITIYGNGPTTIFRSTSSGGADVFQLNALKNFHIRNLAITATLTGSAGAGSNGISITSGYDNITIEDVQIFNLPSLDKGTYVDGGKAVTVQSDAATNEVGTLTVRGLYAKGCAQGFGFEADLVNMLAKKVAVDVDLVAESCFEAVIYSAGAATGVIPAGAGTGIRVRGTAINCQIDALVSRAHGIDIDLTVVTTKTATERTKNPTGATWFAGNIIVQALLCTYAKDSRIAITGNKGGCHYKAQIGGATAGSSGQGPSTDGCSFYLDIGGTSTVSDLNDVISGGSSMSTSTLYISPATATTFPASFYAEANANTLTRGPTMRLVSPLVSADLRFAMSAAGNVETGRIDLFGNITGLQGKATGNTDQAVVAMCDSAGTPRVGVVNGNGIAIDSVSTSSNIGSYVGKYRVLNMAGATLGYIPIYG